MQNQKKALNSQGYSEYMNSASGVERTFQIRELGIRRNNDFSKNSITESLSYQKEAPKPHKNNSITESESFIEFQNHNLPPSDPNNRNLIKRLQAKYGFSNPVPIVKPIK